MKATATICLALLLSGCKLATAPESPHLGYQEALQIPATDPNAVPLLHVSGRVRGDKLVITARLDPDSEVMLEPYDRWYFTARLDVDQDPSTGQPMGPTIGWEYLTWDYGSGTNAYDAAGNETGSLNCFERRRSYTMSIPLSAIGGDDGLVRGVFIISWRNPPDPTRGHSGLYLFESTRGAGPNADPFEHIASR